MLQGGVDQYEHLLRGRTKAPENIVNIAGVAVCELGVVELSARMLKVWHVFLRMHGMKFTNEEEEEVAGKRRREAWEP